MSQINVYIDSDGTVWVKSSDPKFQGMTVNIIKESSDEDSDYRCWMSDYCDLEVDSIGSIDESDLRLREDEDEENEEPDTFKNYYVCPQCTHTWNQIGPEGRSCTCPQEHAICSYGEEVAPYQSEPIENS